VYIQEIEDSEMPISAENTQNNIWAVAGSKPVDAGQITNTMASGARNEKPFQGASTNIA